MSEDQVQPEKSASTETVQPAQPTQDQDQITEGVADLSVKPKKKQRKEQTEEEFNEQKAQFQASGPQINTQDWLFDQTLLDNLDNSKKTDRVHMLHACEKAYYLRDFNKCLSLISQAEKLFGVELENTTKNEDIKSDFAEAGKKTKKSSKVERHVVDLLHIKEACLKKLGSSS
ncbi:hypothetical protein FT663_02308 [Candidozyma haemuli var. vulneris]|uniref:Uncharacterized protein n=1 Tax=Candidozyma haemuli TaxID=45357 RepID=A0A2V1AT91_9ASCO|nr:hypothetical protein CXQ85_004230 [[Candida] haemuloni]KAF3990029.1 hypothetical protein FT662_02480 [[Candida] haemuloni var. vulneris]KAF3992381.1 hypothetical protein FT663_02308 [[Candida] haemuloni var. vulneris]PVH20726.1 hypothetical protein CXQ85_004230 [[Candida] haemuloni]